MARYFFDIFDGSDISDTIGREIEDDGSVCREALRVIGGLLAAEAEDRGDQTLRLTVRNEHGDPISVIRMVCQVEAVS